MAYKRFFISCLDCKREISKSNFTKHLDSTSCQKPRIKTIKICEFCCNNYTQSRHVSYCPDNPHRKFVKKSNQFTKAKESNTVFVVTDTTRQKLSLSSRSKTQSVETRQKISTKMKLIAKQNPDTYSGQYNRGKVKLQECSNGFVVIGSWEKTFVDFCVSNSIQITQPKQGFSYIWEGPRTYYPDFYLPTFDVWVEIKGVETERDRSKWCSLRNTHKQKLMVIDKKTIHDLGQLVGPLGFEPRTAEL